MIQVKLEKHILLQQVSQPCQYCKHCPLFCLGIQMVCNCNSFPHVCTCAEFVLFPVLFWNVIVMSCHTRSSYVYTYIPFMWWLPVPAQRTFTCFSLWSSSFPLSLLGRRSFLLLIYSILLIYLSQDFRVLLKPLVLLTCLCSSCLCFPGAVPVLRCVVWRLFHKFLSLYLATLMYVWLVHVDSGCPFSPVDIAPPHPTPLLDGVNKGGGGLCSNRRNCQILFLVSYQV